MSWPGRRHISIEVAYPRLLLQFCEANLKSMKFKHQFNAKFSIYYKWLINLIRKRTSEKFMHGRYQSTDSKLNELTGSLYFLKQTPKCKRPTPRP